MSIDVTGSPAAAGMPEPSPHTSHIAPVAEPPRLGAADIAFAGLWFALLSGASDSARFVADNILRNRIGTGRHSVWLAPVSAVLVFLVPVLLATAAVRFWPTSATVRVATAVLTFLCMVGVFDNIRSLNNFAVAALAAGVAVQASRMIARHPEAFRTLVRRGLGVLVPSVVLTALALLAWEPLSERRVLAALPPAEEAAPNVLLVVLDTVRAQNMSLYGYERETTPNIDRLAREGVTFDHAFTTAPWTLPAHATMFTGRYHHELSVGWGAPLDGTHPTLAERLAQRGYAAAGFAANPRYCSRQTGLARGFAHYEGPNPLSRNNVLFASAVARKLFFVGRVEQMLWQPRSRTHMRASEINEKFLTWMDGRPDRPFFVFLNYLDAHDPYTPPPPFDTKFGRARTGEVLEEGKRHTPAELDELEAAYDGGIAYLDEQIGALMTELERRGLLDNTVFIVTSDHGEHFERGLVGHCKSLYSQLLRVPLVVRFPARVPAGVRVSEPATIRDLPATVDDLIGAGGALGLPGTSLRGFWDLTTARSRSPVLAEVTPAPNQPAWHPYAKGRMTSIVLGRMHLIRSADGREELYDVIADPEEVDDLSGRAEFAAEIEGCRAALDAHTKVND